jgi:methyl-accepting chemotaxis protein
MKFRRDASIVLVGVAVVVTLLITWTSSRLFDGMTASVEQSQYDSMEAVLVFNVEAAQARALSRAEMIAGLSTTRQLLASRDRARLSAEYLEMFEVQRDKHGIDQMQFHVPPATSFLRLHAPERYDDDQMLTRPLVVAANRDQVAGKGVGLATYGPALFGVAPVTSPTGEHVGSFEVGIGFASLLDNLKLSHGLELALFIEEDLLDPTAVARDVFDDDNRVGKYVKYHSTHWELMKELVSSTDLSRAQEPIRYHRDALGVPYGVVLVPVYGSSGAPLGVIAAAKNFDASRAAAGQSTVWQGLLALFAIVVFAGTIQIVVRGFLVRPVEAITRRFGMLADGEPGKPIAEADMLCSELQALVAQHERLRVQAETRRASEPHDGGGAP